MFTEDELIYINIYSNYDNVSKSVCKKLAEIYFKYSKIKIEDCFCTSISRYKFHKTFYNWFKSIESI